MLHSDQKDQVLQATDLARLIGEHVRLQPRGKEHVGLCPFHDDKKPSMYVSPAKQIYKCFSCGAGGDAFSFVMNYHKLTFPEALKYLADRAGIELVPSRRQADHTSQGPTTRQRIAQANAQAMAFYQAMLADPKQGEEARAYIEKRGISEAMVKAFGLGTSQNEWDALAQTVARKQWDAKAFVLAGLITPRQRDEAGQPVGDAGPQDCYDRLRHRLIFPIFDALNRPIAFGGRRLDDQEEPKYLNSPETELFNKSATLYGIHLAKKPIIDSRTAVIVEGYTDVIAAHQAGASNVVATLGTALTGDHLRELRRYAQKVVLIFDADEAGQKAADRAVSLFLHGELDVTVAVLPDGQDPADLFSTSAGLATWNDLIEQAPDALSYQYQRMARQFEQADTLAARQRLIEDYLRQLAELGVIRQNSIRRAMIVRQVADLVGMPPEEVMTLLRRMAQARRPEPGPQPEPGDDPTQVMADEADLHDSAEPIDPQVSAPRLKALRLAQRQVIGCLLRNPQWFEQVQIQGRSLDEALAADDMIDELSRDLFDRLHDFLSGETSPTLASFLAGLSEQGLEAHCNEVTLAVFEADRMAEDGEEHVRTVLAAAAAALIGYQQERHYLQQRQGPPQTEAQKIQRVLEFHRANPSAARIPRLNASP